MAGHSKWAKLKHVKGATDAKKGAMFTKLIKEIMVATRMGGADPAANSRLRLALDKARGKSVPKDTIARAIAKASGELGADNYETLLYEGYGPAGVAILVECLTDNRARTVADVKHAFTKGGFALGAPGSVAYQFQKKGVFVLPKGAIDEDTLTLAVLDGGGEDVQADDESWIVTSPFESYDACKSAIEALGVTLDSSEITMIPDNSVALSDEDTVKLEKLIERLEDVDDVQETYTNAG